MTDHSATLAERLKGINDRIARVQARIEATTPVTLVAVSKRQPLASIRQALAEGVRHFGENYVQEGVDKIKAIDRDDICWHHIGPIQSNKCADIAAHFDWAQGVDRIKIVRRLSDARDPDVAPLNICIQVNLSREASKSGVAPEAAAELCAAAAELPGLRLRGLMAIPAPASAGGDPRRDFDALRALYEQIRVSAPGMDTLSMGMSDDYEHAIAAGATMVRVGSALFGPRQ